MYGDAGTTVVPKLGRYSITIGNGYYGLWPGSYILGITPLRLDCPLLAVYPWFVACWCWHGLGLCAAHGSLCSTMLTPSTQARLRAY